MTIYIYRWKIKSGSESQFEKKWLLVTKSMQNECGSYGSRLHVNESGMYLAYAQWPDSATREKCELGLDALQGLRAMTQTIEEHFPVEKFEVKSDHLLLRRAKI